MTDIKLKTLHEWSCECRGFCTVLFQGDWGQLGKPGLRGKPGPRGKTGNRGTMVGRFSSGQL